MWGELVIDRNDDQDTVILSLHGELDLASAPLLERALVEAESSNPMQLLVDLAGLGFIDSTGMHVLFRARQRAQVNGHRLTFRRGPAQVQRLFEITGSLKGFEFED